ncbi:hypothetical protein OFC21_05455, partial [Escherichia coli]|nr:hypothetical protein [Escherichia coli]
GTVCVVGKIRDLILQLSKSSIYSTKPTGYYGSAYRSPENWTTALRSSHFSAAARRGIISDKFVEAILQFWRER